MIRKEMALKSITAPPRKVHYVLSTHWDREWYQTFQDYRQRLVALLDRTLDDLAAGRLKGPFTTDGQSILLDDYLEIRPERRAQVEEFARTDKLKIGPWFVLPDEWLVSGEALVRNLRLGREVARQYGGVPSDAGFVCDLFGHIGQLPQLLAGFGIKGGFIWRGLAPRKTAHFLWEGSDGTRLPCYRFGRNGYCDYGADVRRITQPDMPFEVERGRKDLKAFLDKEAARATLPPLIVFDGGDHLEYDTEHYQLMFAQKAGAEFPYEINHSTLDAYLDDMLLHADKITDVVRGELRDTGRAPQIQDGSWLIPSVLSSRVWIKQANADCQTQLCHWAEPFGAVAKALAGHEYPQGYLEVAWRWLLMNHPHDSICGCSIDAVHEDMKFRFAQSRQIAARQTTESLRTLTAAVAGEVAPRELRVLVANPLPRELNEPVELTLQIPAEWQCFQEGFGFELKPGFRVFDDTGKELPYQRLAQALNRTKTRIRPTKFPQTYKTNDITVCLELAVPALGYTTLTVREGAMPPKDEIVPEIILPTRHPETPGLATSERSMANEFLAVTVESNGSLTLTDQRTGQTYSRLLTFEDIADIGDGWYHGQAMNDQTFVSTAAGADVALLQNGPLQCRFRVRTVLRVPVEFKFDRMVRAEEFSDLVVDNLITLRRGCDRLEINTTVKNFAKDHRLRVLFPTGVKASTYLADGAFDVVERDIALPADNHLGRELSVEPRPQQSWTAVSDARRGLAVVSSGLLESCVRDLPERPLALTLFRATRRTVFTDGEPEGELQGELRFDYWLVPFQGAADRARLCDLGVRLAAGVRDVQMSAADVAIYRGKTTLPPQSAFLSLTGGVVITSVREAGGALEIRLFNPQTKAAATRLDFSGRPRGVTQPHYAQRVNFESRPQGRPTAFAGTFKTTLKPKEIVTLRFIAKKMK
ncbi:MAG: glycoside hydrolase family 38 C-terminal domain-containing protein [Verrucomicrobiales bacterium]|nr:glycoside hydrolase family 38 C-terminal domain-containing protein [Verrucomicrobiales bacterium]